jgi:hypothetical protein
MTAAWTSSVKGWPSSSGDTKSSGRRSLFASRSARDVGVVLWPGPDVAVGDGRAVGVAEDDVGVDGSGRAVEPGPGPLDGEVDPSSSPSSSMSSSPSAGGRSSSSTTSSTAT